MEADFEKQQMIVTLNGRELLRHSNRLKWGDRLFPFVLLDWKDDEVDMSYIVD